MMVINASAAATLLEQRPEKNSGSEWDSNPRPLRCRCSALPTELSKPHESGRSLLYHMYVTISVVTILGPSITSTYKGLTRIRPRSHVALIAQLGEHCTSIAEVVGSNPAQSLDFFQVSVLVVLH